MHIIVTLGTLMKSLILGNVEYQQLQLSVTISTAQSTFKSEAFLCGRAAVIGSCDGPGNI